MIFVNYIFYKLYKLFADYIKINEPLISAIIGIYLLLGFTILDILLILKLWFRVNIANIHLPKPIAIVIITGFLFLFIIYYVYKKRYLKILERFDNKQKDKNKQNFVFLFIYIFLLIIIFLGFIINHELKGNV